MEYVTNENSNNKNNNQETNLNSGEQKKAEGNGKVLRITICIVVMLGLIAAITAVTVWYLQKVNYYETHYFSNTYINGIDCSDLEVSAVAEMLDEQAGEYSLQIWGRNEAGESVQLGAITGEQIDLTLTDAIGAAEDILEQQDEKWWMKADRSNQHAYSVVQSVSFNEDMLKEQLNCQEAFQKEKMIPPQDAYIGDFSEEKQGYVLIPEKKGTMLDMESVEDCVQAAIYGNSERVDLEEQGCYKEPKITAEDEKLLSALHDVNQWLGAEIVYDWNGFETVVDASVINKWVSIEEGIPVLNEEAVAAFVAENADRYDTYGKPRSFMTTTGTERILPSGAFGWKTDREKETAALLELIRDGSTTEREPIYSCKAPAKGMHDIGSSYVEADLTNQHLYLYHKGELVLETDFVSGDMRVPGNITPQGVFGLTYKTTNAVLRGQDYETPVNYWMPFHGNFGMHDATWRSQFGGDIYLTDGSHGCLNLPLENAAILYDYLYAGHPVICYY